MDVRTLKSIARTVVKVASERSIEGLLAGLNARCVIVTVVDGHPAALGWLGSVLGHPARALALGVEHLGQTGTIADLYRHYGIDTNGILAAVS